MGHEDNKQGLARVVILTVLSATVLLICHYYFSCYSLFKSAGFAHKISDSLFLAFDKKGFFSNTWYVKGFILLLLSLFAVGYKPKKKEGLQLRNSIPIGIFGLILYLAGIPLLSGYMYENYISILYIVFTSIGYLMIITSIVWIKRCMGDDLMDDVFNDENESFMQETRLMKNEYSVNLPTEFYYKKKWRKGWINIVNPFRAIEVLGTPGSGKSYAVVNNFIKQTIEKGFAQYIYDYKYPDLSIIAYNHLLNHHKNYDVKPKFYTINFDDAMRSHRCNPLNPKFMEDITDAQESAYTILMGLNRTWIQKQGDFFVESPIILLTALIWFLRKYEAPIEDENGNITYVKGAYCTLPHVLELINMEYADYFPILTADEEIKKYLSSFMDAWEGGAQDQLQGQIASAKIPLTKLISPDIYWVMSGDDFTLDLNNPDDPKVLCIGNNPDKQNVYGAVLGLYNSRIVKIINKKRRLKCAVIIDELPTIYFRGLDNLIATARSNKVAVCLGFQDNTQLIRDYGDKEAKAIINTIGNIFSGQVLGETADSLSKRFGKNKQERKSKSISSDSVSTSISTQMDSLIPASKISNLSQGMFVGAVADNFGEEIKQKIFHCKIIVDVKKVKEEEKNYKEIPKVLNIEKEELDIIIKENYRKINEQIREVIKDETNRILNSSNPDLMKVAEKILLIKQAKAALQRREED